MGLGTNGSANGLSKRLLVSMAFAGDRDNKLAREVNVKAPMDFDELDVDGRSSKIALLDNDLEHTI